MLLESVLNQHSVIKNQQFPCSFRLLERTVHLTKLSRNLSQVLPLIGTAFHRSHDNFEIRARVAGFDCRARFFAIVVE
jgi:hypothetical protein